MYHLNGRETCFDCYIAKISTGDPGVHTFPNGDPGYPPTPPDAECLDPLACKLLDIREIAMDQARELLEKGLRDLPARVYVGILNDFDELVYTERFARYCPHFQPVLIDVCACCGTAINQPKFSWKLWADGWEEEVVCSELCKRLLEERMRFKSDTPFSSPSPYGPPRTPLRHPLLTDD